MSSEEQYKCTLDAASIKKAEKELNETAKEREGAVETLRQWVKDNSSWLKSPTDTKFLLSMLRPSKFAQLAARKRLVKYWQVRTQNEDWFVNLDTRDPNIVRVLRTGNLLILPKRDKDGRLVFIVRTAAFDPSEVTVKDLMRASAAAMDFFLADENIQVNGTVLLLDFTAITLKHQTFYGPEYMKKSMDAWLRGFAARYKSVHYYNTNPIFEVIFAIVQPLLPDKMKKRLHFHGKNLGEVYKHIDQSCLPRDYLPDDYSGKCIGSIQDIIEQQIKKLQEPAARDYIKRLSSSGYRVDEAKKPKDDELFAESFRKLNIE